MRDSPSRNGGEPYILFRVPRSKQNYVISADPRPLLILSVSLAVGRDLAVVTPRKATVETKGTTVWDCGGTEGETERVSYRGLCTEPDGRKLLFI